MRKNMIYLFLSLMTIVCAVDNLYGQRNSGIYFNPYADFSKEVSIVSSSYSDLLFFENNVLTFSPIFIRHGWGAITLLTNIGYGYAKTKNNRFSPMTNYLGDFDHFNVSKEKISLNLGFCYLLDEYGRTEPFVKCNFGVSSLNLSESFFVQDVQVANLEFNKIPISTFKIQIGVNHIPESNFPNYDDRNTPLNYMDYSMPVNYGASVFFERNQYFSYFGLSFFVGVAGSDILKEILIF